MKLKTSLFNKSLLKSDFKRFWWIGLLYTLILFFILPFNHLVAGPPGTDQYRREMFRRSLDLASGQNEFQILLICVVPVLIAVLL
ncbi:MAG: ABC transporter permease, partial [Dehalobacterium sp.]